MRSTHTSKSNLMFDIFMSVSMTEKIIMAKLGLAFWPVFPLLRPSGETNYKNDSCKL